MDNIDHVKAASQDKAAKETPTRWRRRRRRSGMSKDLTRGLPQPDEGPIEINSESDLSLALKSKIDLKERHIIGEAYTSRLFSIIQKHHDRSLVNKDTRLAYIVLSRQPWQFGLQYIVTMKALFFSKSCSIDGMNDLTDNDIAIIGEALTLSTKKTQPNSKIKPLRELLSDQAVTDLSEDEKDEYKIRDVFGYGKNGAKVTIKGNMPCRHPPWAAYLHMVSTKRKTEIQGTVWNAYDSKDVKLSAAGKELLWRLVYTSGIENILTAEDAREALIIESGLDEALVQSGLTRRIDAWRLIASHAAATWYLAISLKDKWMTHYLTINRSHPMMDVFLPTPFGSSLRRAVPSAVDEDDFDAETEKDDVSMAGADAETKTDTPETHNEDITSRAIHEAGWTLYKWKKVYLWRKANEDPRGVYAVIEASEKAAETWDD